MNNFRPTLRLVEQLGKYPSRSVQLRSLLIQIPGHRSGGFKFHILVGYRNHSTFYHVQSDSGPLELGISAMSASGEPRGTNSRCRCTATLPHTGLSNPHLHAVLMCELLRCPHNLVGLLMPNTLSPSSKNDRIGGLVVKLAVAKPSFTGQLSFG